MLSTSITNDADALADQFKSATPFKHLVIDGFFKPEFCQKLLDAFPSFDEKLAMNENGEIGRKAVNQKIYNLAPPFKKLDGFVKSQEFLQLLEKITGINGLIYDPHYLGGGTHENLEGQDLDPHVDFTFHPTLKAHRRINLIIYLNREWSGEWGGNIEFHKDPRLPSEQDEIISVEPLFNRAVIFETNNHSWHGFPRIILPEDRKTLSRKSIALYFYTKTREEKIKPHSTIYVERHLPPKFQPGRQLSEGDVEELKILLARRDQHLKRLYTNISNHMSEIEKLRHQRDELISQNTRVVHGNKPNDTAVGQDELLRRIHDLENSTSWKITAPMRAISSLFKH